ncbi:DUF2213 domain-containing protein [Pantoea brenneri]|uniref:DUF2213 domain-containing protein n=1 Tax=Pantoea brenneri TaxID=472694 RepID=UPI002448E0CA|nr:DUF2213 domain-containing protein [Pantoea brenneri]MDH1085308.1 DUF2213 domain-containing protein [Pantoea brenneri]
MRIHLTDSNISYDSTTKTAISVRDGVLEYLGAEIGQEPPDKVFTVYRSPATIAKMAALMQNIPLTNDHVTVGEPVTEPIGKVIDAAPDDHFDELTSSTFAVRNSVDVDPAYLDMLASGKRQLSWGYDGELVPHDKYDFEQRDLIPHHLAVVEAGRCGVSCQFIDKKPTTPETDMTFTFKDDDGAVSMQKIVEVVSALPEAIKSVPVEKLAELVPVLQELIATASDAGVELEVPEEETPVTETPIVDEGETLEEGKKIPVQDSKAFKDAVLKMTDAAVKRHASVIEKAKSILPDSYSFADKATNQIMRDALAVESSEKFSDAELPLAFKMLKKNTTYQSFGDAKADDWVSQIAEKDI